MYILWCNNLVNLLFPTLSSRWLLTVLLTMLTDFPYSRHNYVWWNHIYWKWRWTSCDDMCWDNFPYGYSWLWSCGDVFCHCQYKNRYQWQCWLNTCCYWTKFKSIIQTVPLLPAFQQVSELTQMTNIHCWSTSIISFHCCWWSWTYHDCCCSVGMDSRNARV